MYIHIQSNTNDQRAHVLLLAHIYNNITYKLKYLRYQLILIFFPKNFLTSCRDSVDFLPLIFFAAPRILGFAIVYPRFTYATEGGVSHRIAINKINSFASYLVMMAFVK